MRCTYAWKHMDKVLVSEKQTKPQKRILQTIKYYIDM